MAIVRYSEITAEESCCLKKNAQCESCEFKFYLGQNVDYSLGDSASVSSKKLLQRSREEGQYTCGFGEEAIHAIKHFFLRMILLVTRSSHHREGF